MRREDDDHSDEFDDEWLNFVADPYSDRSPQQQLQDAKRESKEQQLELETQARIKKAVDDANSGWFRALIFVALLVWWLAS